MSNDSNSKKPAQRRTRPIGRPFKKGQSDNPSGQTNNVLGLGELARRNAPKYIRELERLALNARNERVRVTAINALLAIGFGKPAQQLSSDMTPKLVKPTSIICQAVDPDGKPTGEEIVTDIGYDADGNQTGQNITRKLVNGVETKRW